MGWFSTIVSAVAGPLVSGIFGSKKKKQTTSNTVDYQALVRNAEAAGFNPLTALRNGGSAGFTQTHAPVLSSSAYFANALGEGLSTGLQAAFDYDPLREEKSALEMQIQRATLARINQDIASATRLGGAPVATGGRYKRQEVSLSKGGPLTAGDRTVTNPWWDGVEVNPRLVDTEVLEARYGEGLLTNIAGWGINGTADFFYNAPKAYNRWMLANRRVGQYVTGLFSGGHRSVAKKPVYRKDAQGYLRRVD